MTDNDTDTLNTRLSIQITSDLRNRIEKLASEAGAKRRGKSGRPEISWLIIELLETALNSYSPDGGTEEMKLLKLLENPSERLVRSLAKIATHPTYRSLTTPTYLTNRYDTDKIDSGNLTDTEILHNESDTVNKPDSQISDPVIPGLEAVVNPTPIAAPRKAIRFDWTKITEELEHYKDTPILNQELVKLLEKAKIDRKAPPATSSINSALSRTHKAFSENNFRTGEGDKWELEMLEIFEPAGTTEEGEGKGKPRLLWRIRANDKIKQPLEPLDAVVY